MNSTSTTPMTAYLLVTHGSRDRRPQEAITTLTHTLAQKLGRKASGKSLSIATAQSSRAEAAGPADVVSGSAAIPIGSAVLELGPVPLRSQIEAFVTQTHLPVGSRLRILPLFLLAGVHVMEDIPEEIAAAQMQLGDRVELDVLPHFGATLEHLAFLLKQGQGRFMSPIPNHWILMAHGSRRSNAVTVIETLAKQLNMKTAYWVQPNSLKLQIEQLIAETSDATASTLPLTIGVLPCFLFEGGLTDAIAHQVLELGIQFPQVELRLGPTLGAMPSFAERVQAALHSD